MPPWMVFAAGLVGALIGAFASVGAQIVNQSAIRRREDRDKLRAACIEFAEAAFRLVQRAELVLIYTHNQVDSLAGRPVPQAIAAEQYRLIMDAGSALDQLSTALCRVTMLRHKWTSLDDGEALYRELMRMPTETSTATGETLDDVMKMADRKRVEIREWLGEQARRLA